MKKLVLLYGLILLFTANLPAQNITESNGVYYSGEKPYTGVYTTYFDNGNTKMAVALKEGLKDGETRLYFENGTINEVRSYKANQMNGTWETFNEKGIQTALANYKEGKKHGEWKIWDDNGHLIYEMNYENGEKAGKWKKFSATSGELLSERTF